MTSDTTATVVNTVTPTTTVTTTFYPTTTPGQGQSSLNCDYEVLTGTYTAFRSYSEDSSTESSFQDCLNACDNDHLWLNVVYQFSTGLCLRYDALHSAADSTPNPDFYTAFLTGCTG